LKLLPYQLPHADKIEGALRTGRLAIDGSDPGVGKTYVAAEVARRVGFPQTLVVCPKVSIPTWRRVLEGFGVPVLDVVNYEKLRTGNTVHGKWVKRTFEWTTPPDTLLIFDEVHRCKGRDSQNAKMLRDGKGRPLLLLSATLADNPMELRAIAHVAGLSDWFSFWGWLLRNGCKKGRFGMEFDKRRKDVLKSLHAELFQRRGARIRIPELGDQFPETQITAEALDFGDDIAKVYKEMEEELEALQEASADDVPAQQLTVALRARQRVELCKVPGIVSLAKDFLDSGQSVVVFTNFRATLEAVCEKLGTKCAIHGEQSAHSRQQCIDDFQSNKERLIVVNIQAGGVSLSLHDTSGENPRVALVCPTYSAVELRQALGRVHRAGGGKSLQRILFASGTIEEKVCERVNAKLSRLDLLNDGDLDAQKSLNEETPTVSTIAQGLSDQMQPTTTEAEKEHSKHSPSSLENKRKCEGWFNDPDPNRDSSAADRGTLGHLMCEKEDFTLAPDDPVLTENAKKCFDFLQQFYRPGSAHRKELRLQIQDQFGHLDHLFIHKDGSADLIDLKFAQNIYRADSAQFWAYMIGVWDAFQEIDEIRVWVLHPFLDHVDTETFSRAKSYGVLNEVVRKIIERAENPDPDRFQIGKHCNYCGRLATCKKWAQFGVEVASKYGAGGELYKLPDDTSHGSDISDVKALAVLWKIAPIVKKAADGWRKAALEKRMEGEDIPGLELFEKQGAREINNAVAAFNAVSDKIDPKDFIEACDVKIGALEKLFADSFPRGKKASSKKELMARLLDADAVSSGAPVPMLRELKSTETK